MDSYTNGCIKGTKMLIDSYINDKAIYDGYKEISKSYFFTNENISCEYSYINFDNVYKVLSVLSSGDHIFNLIDKDIYDIDTFDINKLTEYYTLGFKRSLILKYTYKEFKSIMDNIKNKKYSLVDIIDIFNSIYNYMDSNYKEYWKSIIDYSYKESINNNIEVDLFECITRIKNSEVTDKLVGNNYLKNEDNYNKLRNNISKCNISFKACDAVDLYSVFNGNHYDLIILSNILDYLSDRWGYEWKYKKLKRYENELKGLLNKKGIILLHYFFNYYENNNRVIISSSVKSKDFKKEEIITFKNDYDGNSGIVLVKK